MKKRTTLVAIVLVAGVAVAWAYPYFEQKWAQYELRRSGLTDWDTPNPILDQVRFVEAACNEGNALLFVNAGYSPDATNLYRWGPLHCAAMRGDMELARALLRKKADPKRVVGNQDNNFGPIHYAAAFHHLDMVKLLVRYGADINQQSDFGTPLMVAANQRDGTRLAAPSWHSQISKKRDIDQVDPVIFEEFLKLGARTDGTDNMRNTLLHVAAATYNRSLSEALLDKGMDINAANARGETPFLLAVRNAEIDNRRQHTRDIAFVAFMIARGANVNARTIEGYSAIFEATARASVGQHDLLDLLVMHGADINVATVEGTSVWRDNLPTDTIVAWAERFPHIDIPLRPDGSPGRGPLHVYAQAASPELVAYFLKRGMNASAVDFQGYTPLHYVLASTARLDDWNARRIEVAKQLLAAGADMNARTAEGFTPLMMAANQPSEVIRFLVENGADVKAAVVVRGEKMGMLYLFGRSKNTEALEILRVHGAK